MLSYSDVGSIKQHGREALKNVRVRGFGLS